MKPMIGENIKRLRNLKNITQAELAEAMNVSCASVSKWERADSYPDITLLQPLAYYFGVTIDEIMGYDSSKVEQEIDCILKRYYELYSVNPEEAYKIITKARVDFPNDFRVMDCYMWNLAGDYADNDKMVLLEHKEEFSNICKKILQGCNDNRIRLDAINMQAKLLWAEGKTDEAVTLYKDNFPNWYQTSGQKIEQLFPKDTEKFMNCVRKNLYELASFTADKLVKSIFYNINLSSDEIINQVKKYGELAIEMYERTNDILFVVIAKTIYGRLANDLIMRENNEICITSLTDKYLNMLDIINGASKSDDMLLWFIGEEYPCLRNLRT